MAILPILLWPDPILQKKCTPVENITDAHRKLLDDMLATMYAAPGIGLAASQVGNHERLIVVDVVRPKIDVDEEEYEDGDGDEDEEIEQPFQMINPEITYQSEEKNLYEEGCLSLPDIYANVKRPSIIEVRYQTPDGKIENLRADGLLATCIQHEIDHLDGRMFTHRLTRLKREMLHRKFLKMQEIS